MNKKLERTLTHIFGMTRKRDALLGELLYSLKTETQSRSVEDIGLRLANSYNKSEEVGQCLAEAVHYIKRIEGPEMAHRLCYRLAMAACDGPVAIILGAKLPELERRARIEPEVRQKTASLLDRIRFRDLGAGTDVLRTRFCYQRSDKQVQGNHPVLKPVEPYDFISDLKRL